jgi:hypothetical protein
MDLSCSLAALPLWVSGLLLVGLTTLLAVFGPILARRFVRAERLAASNAVAGYKFATLGILYAVTLAFAVIVVWERFRDASGATLTLGSRTSLPRNRQRYRGSLQLFASEKSATSRSLPQIFLPALLGCCRKCAFRSAK